MSLIVDRKRFWNLYRAEFGESPQLTVDGLNFFLDRFEVENRLKGIPQFAYVLSTAYHESGKNRWVNGEKVFVRFQPVKETRERSDSPRRANQDRYWNTGFYGRGFPQTTWKRNYLASGEALGLGDKFVKNPDLLLEPQYAYDAMIICMARGIYTGKSLSNYISDTGKDYEEARRVVNGQDRAPLLAKYARAFEQILRDSKTSTATLPATDKPIENHTDKISETADKLEGLPSDSGERPTLNVENIENAKIEAPKPAPQTSPVTVTAERVSVFAKIGAAFTAITALGINLGNVSTTKLNELTPQQIVWLVGACLLFALALWFYDRAARRAHEKTLAKMKTAADPAQNTIELRERK